VSSTEIFAPPTLADNFAADNDEHLPKALAAIEVFGETF
jgi:hypothetical protein